MNEHINLNPILKSQDNLSDQNIKEDIELP
jgi:hypothetical protein